MSIERRMQVAGVLRGALNVVGSGYRPSWRADDLRAAAERRSGLTDYGPEEEYLPGFEMLLASVVGDLDQDPFGAAVLHNAVVGSLATRLQFVAARAASPQAMARPVRAPLFIVGMPRTGSTLLQQLLSCHPTAIGLPTWLAMTPMPVPSATDWARGGDRRRAFEARMASRLVRLLAPDQMMKHPVVADQFAEDTYLQMSTFESIQWWGLAPIRRYVPWLLERSGELPYRVLRDHLKLYQQHVEGTHWVLKSPGHFFRLRDLLTVFPDARVVLLHRDPARVVASAHSLLSSGHAITNASADPHALHRLNVLGLSQAAEQVVATRDAFGDDRFMDVHYRRFIADPPAMVRAIHRWAGIEHGADAERSVETTLRVEKPHRFGHHRYGPGVLDDGPAELRRPFATYIERFDVELE